MKIAYLGPEGSYSHLAAKTFLDTLSAPAFGSNECVPFRNATEVFAAVSAGRVDCATVPIENSLQGGVLQNMDLLQDSKDVYAVAERILKVDHRLVYKEGVKFTEIGRVYSHRQALGQCSAFLSREMPFASLKDSESTAFGLVKAMEDETGKSAAIVGSHTEHIRKGFVMSEECISDEKNNFTHFLLLKKGKESLPSRSQRVFFSTVCPHRPGSLMELLQIIADCGVNMTKIESRPVKNIPGEYRFFIEADCDIADPNVEKMFEKIRANTLECKLLGAYERG
ncbi:MAG: hypothetical protein IJW58_03460 [Clostridia bacterium]|nr:hypothetical protein [Clostridia bacterium]